ncbi:MAG: DDE transposase [Paenibacillaceae bacterium]|nr:MAG: DDE transposase [Paenibacillaceae bacterium]
MTFSVRYKTFDQLSFADVQVYTKLPPHPFWSHVDSKVDFSFADRLCAVLYSGRGQYPYAPSLKLKIHLVQAYYGLSDRQTEEKIIGDLFIKRFLQLPVDFIGFDHSTIGLDRSRMGAAMFRACHLYILAQMYQYGLWGDRNEQWIIDSFPTNVNLKFPGAYRLIQHALIRLAQHLRKHGTKPMLEALEALPLDGATVRLSKSASASARMLAFSKLVSQAYGLLAWFENENIKPFLAEWKHLKRSRELQAILRRILQENSSPVDPGDGADEASEGRNEETGTNVPELVRFQKIPLAERPKNRIVSAVDPEARIAKRSKTIYGYKTQNLCTTGGVILDVRTIPANEHDQDATADMTATIKRFFGVTPSALLGDSAYGHGRNRARLAALGIPVVAPVPIAENPTGLFHSSRFVYDAEKDVYICPEGQQSVGKQYIRQSEGHQYSFAPHVCLSCPSRKACTSSEKGGRRVFRSDYADLYEAARAYNDSLTGRAELQERLVVERKNKELKNDCALDGARTRSRVTLQIKAQTSAMVVNLKLLVRKLGNPKPGFLRRAPIAVG